MTGRRANGGVLEGGLGVRGWNKGGYCQYCEGEGREYKDMRSLELFALWDLCVGMAAVRHYSNQSQSRKTPPSWMTWGLVVCVGKCSKYCTASLVCTGYI